MKDLNPAWSVASFLIVPSRITGPDPPAQVSAAGGVRSSLVTLALLRPLADLPVQAAAGAASCAQYAMSRSPTPTAIARVVPPPLLRPGVPNEDHLGRRRRRSRPWRTACPGEHRGHPLEHDVPGDRAPMAAIVPISTSGSQPRPSSSALSAPAVAQSDSAAASTRMNARPRSCARSGRRTPRPSRPAPSGCRRN